MLDDFKDEQQIVYKEIVNSRKLDKINHSYIIETNGYSNSWNFCLSFVKFLFCDRGYTNNKNCENCSKCLKIDKNEYLELKIIDAEGQWIKKNQLDELQSDFSKKSIIDNKKVYVIKNAEKLNASSSNSLLKFLEEPEDNIIAILMVNKRQQLLKTIVSRCQIFSLSKKKDVINKSTINKIGSLLFENNEQLEQFLNNETTNEKIEKILNFVSYYEENKQNTIIYINKLWNDFFQDRQDISIALNIMLLFYKDVLNCKLNFEVEIFNDYLEELHKIEKINTEQSLINKINKLAELKEYIKYNVNTNLLMDKLIIELEDVI